MSTPQRTIYLDHLRVALTALVILHHTSITYGGSGGWYWREVEPTAKPPLSSIALSLFNATNQAYFMGFFFLLAGYFTPPSYERKGTRRYLVDRLLRLGIPLLVYGYGIGPFTNALARWGDGASFADTLQNDWRHGTFRNGPLWFAQALLLFAVAYTLYRLSRSASALPRSANENGNDSSRATDLPAPSGSDYLPTHATLFLAALFVGALAFLLRLWVPTGVEVWGLQLGYFASYLVLFVVGCHAARSRWLERVPRNMARLWLIIALLTFPVLPIGYFITGLPGLNGGLNPSAALYAFWEPFVAWGLILGLLYGFQHRLNTATRLTPLLASSAYGAYIVHPPVVVGVALAFHAVPLPPLAKFVVVGALAVVASFAIGAALLRLPFARRVL